MEILGNVFFSLPKQDYLFLILCTYQLDSVIKWSFMSSMLFHLFSGLSLVLVCVGSLAHCPTSTSGMLSQGRQSPSLTKSRRRSYLADVTGCHLRIYAVCIHFYWHVVIFMQRYLVLSFFIFSRMNLLFEL